MRTGLLVAAIAASCVLLGGCTAGRSVPPGLTSEEAQQRIDEQNASWWNDMFPGEPQPAVEPIEVVDPSLAFLQSQKCIIDANIEGVRETGGGFTFSSNDTQVQDTFNLAMYVCTLSYPMDVSHPELLGFYSDEQVEYLDDYYRERLAPCLRLLGYVVPNPSPRDDVQSSVGNLPYWIMTPQPQSEAEWTLIELRCPPPPIGPSWRGF